MIALDANVLVRYVIGVHTQQTDAARRLIDGLSEDAPGYVCREASIELAWVLARTYRVGRADLAATFEALLGSPELIFENAADLAQAVADHAAGGAGIADRMIVAAARRAGATETVTFDRDAALLPGMRLLGQE